jgi:hypothetical protein
LHGVLSMRSYDTSRYFRFLGVAVLFPVIFLALSACDDDSSSAQPPQLAQASNWTEVFLKRTCGTIPQDTDCLGQNGFHVDIEGQTSIGPENGPVEAGALLSTEEANLVVSAANAVAEQQLSTLTLRCQAWIPAPGENSVIMKLREQQDSTLRTVYQKSLTTLQLCYRGEKALAEALFNVVNPLVDRYGATPAPTPSPSPSESPSASP